MYSTKRNIQQLVSLMLKRGITDVVVCPGSRNAPLAHTFAAAGMRCHEVTDERSAGFFAIGLIEAKERAVAVCCTSGSAVLNLAPAVAEAYYRPLPLLVITADRPACWIGQMDGQTLPQQAAFGRTVRKVVNLPESTYDNDTQNTDNAWYANRLINEAMIELERSGGPVHINIPISEPLFDFSATELPDERIISYSSHLTTEMAQQWRETERKMIVAGQMTAAEAYLMDELIAKLDNGCVVLAEHLSNLHGDIISNFDEILTSCKDTTALQPDLLITLGGHIVSKKLKQWLRSNPPQQHWQISENGEVVDLFRCVTHIIEAKPESFVAQLAGCSSTNNTEYAYLWKAEAEKVVPATSDEVEILRNVAQYISKDWNIHVANSCMVRNLQKIGPLPCDIHCNRGVNGIEGSMSAAVGYAVGSGRKTLLLIGDLSFFYDQNALWNKHTDGCCLRILLLNNGGGEIFNKLPGLEASPYKDTLIAGAHHTTAEGAALANGCEYKAVSSLSEVADALPWLMSDEKGVRILEVSLPPMSS